jgi:hypothetical protein
LRGWVAEASIGLLINYHEAGRATMQRKSPANRNGEKAELVGVSSRFAVRINDCVACFVNGDFSASSGTQVPLPECIWLAMSLIPL